MRLVFRKNVALNVDPAANSQVAGFYESLGLESKKLTPDFTVLGPAPYSCYVVSWEPRPAGKAEVCLQFETDDIEEARKRILAGKGEIVSFGEDPNSPGKHNLWFRDPAGNLMNIVEMQ